MGSSQRRHVQLRHQYFALITMVIINVKLDQYKWKRKSRILIQVLKTETLSRCRNHCYTVDNILLMSVQS